jgi:hypothetical protein
MKYDGTFKGSIIVKRTEILDMIENYKSMFKSNISDDARRIVWGQEIMLTMLLEDNGFDTGNHNDFTHWIWDLHWSKSCKPADTFKWLFDPTPLLIEEERELFRLLNQVWWT